MATGEGMKLVHKSLVSTFLAFMLLTGRFTPVYAALGIASVSPNSIVNNAARTITVTGTDFVSGAVVSLNGYGDLSTTFTNATTLSAVVPARIPAGQYTVKVTNPDTTTAVLNNGLTVTDPATSPFSRPQLVVTSTELDVNAISISKEFQLTVVIKNSGTADAYNAQAVFGSEHVVSTDTGGVIAVGNLAVGASAQARQTFIAYLSLYGKSVAVIDMTLTYYDRDGASYSDKFTLSVPVSSASAGFSATATPTGLKSGQLVIPSYGTTVNPLQPGSQFTLVMTVQNVGNESASHVTMIIGGGSSGNNSETPQPGGVSGGSGEFTNFAPVGTSNVQSLGDLPAGGMVQVSQNLIVNVSTNPGAYPMKITYSYLNSKGEVVNDEQVITLLVYSLPFVEVSFYRPPDPFFVGQPGMLPIQIVNLGKRTAVLSNMTVTAEGATIENGTMLVGALDAGGYFTLDGTLVPEASGKVILNVVIDYTDDFNEPRKIEKTLEVNVEEGFVEPGMDPSMPGKEGSGGVEFIPAVEETALQKVWRFILGILGLDSAPPAVSPEMQAPEEFIPIQPAPGGGGGKG